MLILFNGGNVYAYRDESPFAYCLPPLSEDEYENKHSLTM